MIRAALISFSNVSTLNCSNRLSFRLVSIRTGVLFALLFSIRSTIAVQQITADVCVYGGVSGGVVAAVQAARMGKSVALISEINHLGGMTTSGLGWTDIGHVGSSYIQGMAREFYTRIGAKYGYGMKTTFEPHVAETVFNEMVQEAGVKVYTNQSLVSVTHSGARIVAITMNNGNIFRAKMFIDASYTGDLMAKAGVSYTVGRESSAQYGESLNGVRPPNSDFVGLNLSPYVISNNPASGLLPLIQAGDPGTPGSADQRVQAYNFRLCLTTVETNKLPISAPPGYNPAQYELLARYIQALLDKGSSPTLRSFITIESMPNGKTDINNNGALSTDLVGGSAAFIEADFATRQQLWETHKNYQQGFLYFLGHDPRVPSNIRNSMLSYGYSKDEFTDNGGWPYELYVREARRMVSDYVVTQSNVFNQLSVPDSIGMAGYFTDSHYCQRVVVDGVVRNEGSARGDITSPYPISYRALIPKASECTNLLVPWSLSASHTAFSSIRMEPVFMILGQAAGTAAGIAIDDHVGVQDVNIRKLQAQLIADKQEIGVPVHTNEDTRDEASLLLDFGPDTVFTIADRINDPAHSIGGLVDSQNNWNSGLIADASGLIYSDGTSATGISINLGRSAVGGTTINFNDEGFFNSTLGGQLNTGIYLGNSPAKDGIYGGTGGNALAVGLRVDGLKPGLYTVYVAGRNTSTQFKSGMRFYCTNGLPSATFAFADAPSFVQENSSPATTSGFVPGDNCNLAVVTIGNNESLFLASLGTDSNEPRGFLNTVAIVPGQPAPAIVNAWATDARASRAGSDPGSITISRNGDASGSLVVYFKIEGTATNGVDYDFIGDSITFPPGVTTLNISIHPRTNATPVGDRFSILSLSTNAGYVVGKLASAKITIQDTPIFSWRWQHFGTSSADLAVAGDSANPAGDGIPNLVKYALGLAPETAADRSLARPAINAEGHLEISFTRPDPPPADIEYQVEASSDLLAWCSDACVDVKQISFNNDNTATVTCEETMPASVAEKQFLRLRVSRQ